VRDTLGAGGINIRAKVIEKYEKWDIITAQDIGIERETDYEAICNCRNNISAGCFNSAFIEADFSGESDAE
jgi:hypothetical protein